MLQYMRTERWCFTSAVGCCSQCQGRIGRRMVPPVRIRYPTARFMAPSPSEKGSASLSSCAHLCDAEYICSLCMKRSAIIRGLCDLVKT